MFYCLIEKKNRTYNSVNDPEKIALEIELFVPVVRVYSRSERMVEDTMFSGESKNIEYKVSLPDKSEKYMKTIVAFANTQGGKLIVGVDDKTHQIVGVENDVLFQLMDGIANAVSDSCVPQIIPDIEPQTVNGKTVIVVSVEAGKNRPYYLKSKGKDNGTYIRVAGTSR